MRTGSASGLQIVILIFAVTLLAVPLSSQVLRWHAALEPYAELLGRFMPFVLGALIVIAIPGLRRLARSELAVPIPPGMAPELAMATALKLSIGFAAIGGIALYQWIVHGGAVMEAAMGGAPSPGAQFAFAFSGPGLLFILAAVTLGPVMEELFFRGFLFRAWERRWGVIPAAILVSTLFALYHTHFLASFAASIVLVCVLRRTGSLRACILVHALYNGLLWYPLAGQFLMPPEGAALGDLATWKLQLACLLFAVNALPAYIWMARHERETDPFTQRLP